MSRPMNLIPAVVIAAGFLAATLFAQEQSVRPGINDSFRSPDVKEFVGKFEVESREVFSRRKEIVAACEIKPGQTVADIGAGTGLYTRLFAETVGKEGRVIAVDIAQKFLDHIATASREAGLKNVDTLLCKADSTELAAESVDLAFICDTYHHFEFPHKTMLSLQRALKPDGRVVVIDFRREEGKSSDWVLSHVRAGKEVFEREITAAGLRKIHEEGELLKENYFVVFEKPRAEAADNSASPGRGRGMGRGPGPEMRADQEVFHYLLENHAKIRRTVTRLENGVDTITESDDPAVATKIQEHVASMHTRVKNGRGLRFWDELFVALFKDYDKIVMVVENTAKGVRVKETSDNRQVATLIQAHADVVSLFVKHGFDEAHKNHPVPVPKDKDAGAKLVFPLVEKYGGVLPRPQAAEQPRAGAKVVMDITTDAKPADVNKGLDRVARLLNLYGAAGMKAADVKITVVLHGEATKSVLKNADYQRRFETAANPNLPLLDLLRQAGVEVLVCGQALNNKGIADNEIADGIEIALSAMTVLVNKQADGCSLVPLP